jgi:hypothetical protein
LVELPRILAREAFGVEDGEVALPIVLNQTDHPYDLPNPLSWWYGQYAVPACSLSSCSVCLRVPGDPGMSWHPSEFDIDPSLFEGVERLYYPLEKKHAQL